MDVREIGRLLGAAMVIEGSVRRHRNKVRVGVRLTDVATGVYLWSGTIERETKDAWVVQQEIAKAVVDAVDLELTAGEKERMGKRHSDNPAAFEFYLKGRHISARMETLSQQEALRLFQSACAADPKYTLPLLGIARCQMNLAFMGLLPPKDAVPAAKAALHQALALDSDLAEAHSIMASVISRHEWNWTEAEKHYRAALRLAPNAPDVHDAFATDYLAPLGRIDQALSENRVARELDPFSPQLRRSHVLILLLGRRLQDAELECRCLLQERPDDSYVRLVLAISLHGQKGRMQESVPQYERVYRDDPRIQTEVYFASISAVFGNRNPAEALLARLRIRSKTEFVPAMLFAWLHLHLGQIQEALTAIEQAYHNGEYELLLSEVGYGFDSFRHLPRFGAIIEKLGLHRTALTVNSL
jgi:eukaryotic-like serine/threonine-protein kinase